MDNLEPIASKDTFFKPNVAILSHFYWLHTQF